MSQDTKHYWVRQYRCINVECCNGEFPIQVTHTTDTKIHFCAWCGKQCEYERDVCEVDV